MIQNKCREVVLIILRSWRNIIDGGWKERLAECGLRFLLPAEAVMVQVLETLEKIILTPYLKPTIAVTVTSWA